MHGDEDYDVHHRTELRRAPGAVRLDQVRMEKGIEKANNHQLLKATGKENVFSIVYSSH